MCFDHGSMPVATTLSGGRQPHLLGRADGKPKKYDAHDHGEAAEQLLNGSVWHDVPLANSSDLHWNVKYDQ